MANLKEDLVSCVKQLSGVKEKLVIVTGKPGSGKSQVLRDLAGTQRWRYVDCRDLVSVHDLYGVLPTEKNAKAVEAMQSILNNYNADVLMLDRIQTLFNPDLGILSSLTRFSLSLSRADIDFKSLNKLCK